MLKEWSDREPDSPWSRGLQMTLSSILVVLVVLVALGFLASVLTAFGV
jgi:hypothetical protein